MSSADDRDSANDAALRMALSHPLWVVHQIGNIYMMDGESGWKIAYYPILECGQTGNVYDRPRVLVEKPRKFNGVLGTDFREVPIEFLSTNPSYLKRKGNGKSN